MTMKKILVSMLMTIFASTVFSQFIISPALSDAINNESGDYLTINIFFDNANSVSELAVQLDKSHAAFDTRVKSVTNLLKENSALSYEKFMEQITPIIQKDEKAVISIEKFWIVNAVNAVVRADCVYQISGFDGVNFIDLDMPRYKIIDGTTVVEENSPRATNGAEWGLKAINAQALWSMNYTGRNVLMLSIDTGVNPEHPAISTNYLGNYMPQSQCWYGMRNDHPRDNASSSHGTHTTGTAMGLDRATNDTIGVAFNAKWIACDPVASTTSELLTVSEFFHVYQWVLNPDGDEETTNDVPRVINNSWGYDYEIAAEFNACSLPENSIVETLEVAGICSPYSAGNEGPGVSTVGYPAMLAYNLVNPMSVAAVSSSLEIASFSSRGPSTCVDEETALKIKPEVSAPGVNVRSCVKFNEYDNLQGTSMACPHVSGALLLLAEAFPMASAKELKESLYYSASDLGDEGEDNDYGMGMIDVFAAYNYLSEIYTPVPPAVENYDVAISHQLIYDTETEVGFIANCLQKQPNITLKIENTEMYDGGDINLTVKSGNEIILDTVFTNVSAENDIEYSLNNFPIHGGMNELVAKITAPSLNEPEYDTYNNSTVIRFYKYFEEEFPYSLDFETGNFPIDNNVLVENPNMRKTWKVLPWGENKENNALAYSFSENTSYRDVDYAYLPQVDLPDIDSLYLNFAYAYMRHYSNGDKDSLFIELSTDCGETFPYTLWINGGPGMYTETGDAGSFYIPVSNSEFDTISVPLSEFRGQNVMIRFKAKSQRNSELYINEISLESRRLDNIREEKLQQNLNISAYPNPTDGILNVQLPIECKGEILSIYDVCGHLVYYKVVDSELFTITLDNFDNGMYIMRLSGTDIRHKIVLLKK